MKRMFKITIILLLFIALNISYSPQQQAFTSTGEALSNRSNVIIEKDFFPEIINNEITIAAVGDVLIHEPVYIDAWTGNNYDFYTMLKKMEPILSEATITTANQESMIGGSEFGLSSYPAFNSPKEVGNALKAVGVDIVVLANNHTLDRGEAIIQRAISHWEILDMHYVGAYKDFADQQKLRIIETDENISVAFLAYTYGTNGIQVPEEQEYLVNLIDRGDIKEEVERAQQQADVVVLQLHFGNEYERLPSEEQKALAQYAADLGVHAVIGHHPHVLQPAEWLLGKDGNETLVIYSLGNFISNQQELYQRIGGVFGFTITKKIIDEQVDIKLHSPSLLPTYVQFDPSWSDYEIVPMHTLSDNDLPGAASHYEEIKAHMSQWLPELTFPKD